MKVAGNLYESIVKFLLACNCLNVPGLPQPIRSRLSKKTTCSVGELETVRHHVKRHHTAEKRLAQHEIYTLQHTLLSQSHIYPVKSVVLQYNVAYDTG